VRAQQDVWTLVQAVDNNWAPFRKKLETTPNQPLLSKSSADRYFISILMSVGNGTIVGTIQ